MRNKHNYPFLNIQNSRLEKVNYFLIHVADERNKESKSRIIVSVFVYYEILSNLLYSLQDV